MEVSGLLIMLMLGLRHGFDPDHIAIIDGIGVRYAAARPALTKWTGTLFAAGHGLVITVITVMLSHFSHSFRFPPIVWEILDWVPGILLILVALLNIRLLRSKHTYRPKGFKSMLIPDRLKNSSHPLSIVVVGMLFAMVFDTSTQATAWAYAATSQLTTGHALLLGLSFSVGMITTDTLDSRILFTLMKRSVNNNSVLHYRRRLGWIIVIISLLVGGYKISCKLIPGCVLPDNLLTAFGVSFFLLMLIFYAAILFSGPGELKKEVYGYQRPYKS